MVTMQRATRLAAVLGVVGLSSGVAMAQITSPVTVNVFGRANRQPGTYQTASAEIPLGTYSVGIRDTMSDSDASDPTNRFILTIFVSPDGVAWVPVHREQWEGGTFIPKGGTVPIPRHLDTVISNTALQSGQWIGWRARAELDLPVTLRVGFDVTVYPQ